MISKNVLVTGGSGLVGGIICRGLRQRGYHIDVFDRRRGMLVSLLRRRYFATSHRPRLAGMAAGIGARLGATESFLARHGVIRESGDDIGAERAELVKRIARSDTVIHLASLPHPGIPGFSDDDYRRINYDDAMKVFEAARDAGARRFILASSIAVYGFSRGVACGMRLSRFPIPEENHRPVEAGSNTLYGILKAKLEDRLAVECAGDDRIRCVSLRLAGPGFRVLYPLYLGVATSMENLVEGFDAVLRNDWDFDFEAFNLMDAVRDPGNLADVEPVISLMWGGVPNHLSGREMVFDTSKLRQRMGWNPVDAGSYIAAAVIGEKPSNLTIVRGKPRRLEEKR
jgi:nucleoside-diphosphate-sugar epimerase